MKAYKVRSWTKDGQKVETFVRSKELVPKAKAKLELLYGAKKKDALFEETQLPDTANALIDYINELSDALQSHLKV